LKPNSSKGKDKMKKIMAFLKDEDGLETVEYAIILGLIVIGTIGLVTALGGWVNTQFETITTELRVTPS
jgi:pilus assembly protein Flp/PilA